MCAISHTQTRTAIGYSYMPKHSQTDTGSSEEGKSKTTDFLPRPPPAPNHHSRSPPIQQEKAIKLP